MNRDAEEKAEALRLLLSARQFLPPSDEERHHAIAVMLPALRRKPRVPAPREDQTSIL